MQEEAYADEVEKHFRVKYSDETCPVCGNRIDEEGYCTCGAVSG